MQTTAKNASISPQPDGRWLALLSSPELDCERDRVGLGGWTWTGASIPLLVGHESTRMPVGRVEPFVAAGKLWGRLSFPARGTSAASDEARGLVEAGTATAVSIMFSAPGAKTRNGDGGIDYTGPVHVHEASLVGVPCCDSCRISGSKCATGTPKTFLVDPRQVVEATVKAVFAAVRAEVNRARGRLDDSPIPPRAAFGAGFVHGGLIGRLAGGREEPEYRALAPPSATVLGDELDRLGEGVKAKAAAQHAARSLRDGVAEMAGALRRRGAL